jgi:HAD superfamily hydrolase (TIGR01509 family)
MISIMTLPPVHAVVFDLGNTLWFEAVRPGAAAIERKQAACVAPLLREWGVALSEPIERVIRDVWAADAIATRREAERERYRETSIPSLVQGALAARGIEITREQGEAWWHAAYLPVREFGVQLYPDTIDVLRELKESGVRVGINTTRPFTADMIAEDLRDFGIAPYVDAVVCSGDAGYVKPHLSTFELVLRLLGVAPQDAAMVGDTAASDMRGGRAAGMRTVWKLNGRYDLTPCPDADYAIQDLAEVLSLPIVRRVGRTLPAAESATPHEDDNAERY